MYKRCPICKKRKLVHNEDYAYKYNGKYYCSWHCLRMAQKSRPLTKEEKQIRKELGYEY